MTDLWMVIVGMLLGAATAALGGFAIQTFAKWRAARRHERRRREAAMGTESTQASGREVVVKGVAVVVHDAIPVTSAVNTRTSSTDDATIISTGQPQPVLVSPEVQISKATDRSA